MVYPAAVKVYYETLYVIKALTGPTLSLSHTLSHTSTLSTFKSPTILSLSAHTLFPTV